VTVLMAVHNGGRGLRASLASILAQGFRDFEFLIVDDGSTDETMETLASLNDSRVRTFRHDRVGLTRSLIRGLALARGEYVARQDADDVSRADRLGKQVAILDAGPKVALVGSGVTAVTEEGRFVDEFVYPADHDGLVAALWRLTSPLPHTTIMFRRSSILECGGYRCPFVKAQDYDLYLRVSERYRLASIPEPLCQLRFSQGSVTLQQDTSQFEYAVLAFAAAVVRREKGIDPLESPTREAFLGQFRRWYASSSYPRRFRSRLLRREARVAWKHRQTFRAVRCLAGAAYQDPNWIVSFVRLGFARDDSWDAARWAREQRGQVA
jgi:glycosyltransferase involved in cell wall biosynthesis